jgi:transcriptional regulator with XRE-family HTH domain
MPQHDTAWERVSVVPPRRLGRLLSEARSARGLTLDELAASADGRFSLAALASIECGARDVSDAEVRVLANLYGVASSSLVPPRSKLEIDLDEGKLFVAGHNRRLPHRAHDREDVLSRYLAMVYSMRHLAPGTPVPLRVDDLEVLGRALRVGSRTLESDLVALMANPADVVGWRARLLRRKMLIPAAGVLVATVAAGALVLMQPASTTANTGGTAVDAPAVTLDIGAPLVQERLTPPDSGSQQATIGVGMPHPSLIPAVTAERPVAGG